MIPAREKLLADAPNHNSGKHRMCFCVISPKGERRLLPIRFPNVCSGFFRRRGAAVFGEDDLIFLHGQIALLQQIIHFTGREIGLL